VVAVTGGTIARQCLEAGLLDEVAIDLVPVVMGAGRPFFGELDGDDVVLGDPTVCIQGDQVTTSCFRSGDEPCAAGAGTMTDGDIQQLRDEITRLLANASQVVEDLGSRG